MFLKKITKIKSLGRFRNASVARVVRALVDALDYVTGDDWHFDFVEGGEAVTTAQSAMPYDEGPYVVMPCSDGLDSFLQWQLLRHEEPNVTVLRVQTASRAIKQARVRAINRAAQNARDRQLRLPVTAHYGHHPEPSYRTRTFLFFCMAALAAAKTGTRRVVVGENGIGALGPSLLPHGDECPHRTTHPAFTRRIAAFINTLLGAVLSFEHPQQFRTKGQVLTHALRYDVTGWELTNSCVRDARAGLGDQLCGVCSGCLLRRTALLAAGCSESGFYWQDLSASTLATCRPDFGRPHDLENPEDIMRHAAHDMSELASIARLDPGHRVLQSAAWELADGDVGRCHGIATDIHGLIRTHACEWEALRHAYSGASLLALETVR